MKEEHKNLIQKMINRVEADSDGLDFVPETTDELMNLLQNNKTSKLDQFGRDWALYESLFNILDSFKFPYQINGGTKWVWFEYHPELHETQHK